MTRTLPLLPLLAVLLVTSEARAQEELSPYRNPSGSISLNAVGGVIVGDRTSLVLGAGVGYAVLTGVMPGVRGLVITGGDGVGGELALTLTLTPPLPGTFTPFVVGEAGRRWDPNISAWMTGVGGGVYLGEPASTVNLQLGYIHRWFFLPGGGTVTSGSPLLGITVRF